jgi:hypothetical protein
LDSLGFHIPTNIPYFESDFWLFHQKYEENDNYNLAHHFGQKQGFCLGIRNYDTPCPIGVHESNLYFRIGGRVESTTASGFSVLPRGRIDDLWHIGSRRRHPDAMCFA